MKYKKARARTYETNPRAKSIFNGAVLILIIFNLIASIGFIYQINTNREFALSEGIIIITILIFLSIGFWAFHNNKAPFHYMIFIGAGINVIFSFLQGEFGMFQLLLSLLIIYLGIRYPKDIRIENHLLKKKRY